MLNFVGRVPSWVQCYFVFWWVFRGLEIFSCEYFVGPNFFFVGISWVPMLFSWLFVGPKCFVWVFRRSKMFYSCVVRGSKKFVSWVFRGFQIFSRGCFVGPKLFLVVFCGYKIFLVGISWAKFFLVLSKFSLVGNFVLFRCQTYEKKQRRNISETSYSISNRFQQLLESYFIY